MKWLTKKEPQLGDTRVRIIFAIRPRSCEDGLTRWLEKVKVFEKYVGFNGEEIYYTYWKEYAAGRLD